MWTESALFGATFVLDSPETLNTMVIFNGAGRKDHKINGIKVQVKTGSRDNWQNLEEVRNESGAEVLNDDGTLSLSSGQEYLEITFKPVERVTAILIDWCRQQTEMPSSMKS